MIKEFYYIENKNSICPGMSPEILNHGPLPILWHNQGLYGLIPAALVFNALILFQATKISFAFAWNQTIPIPQEIGDQLTNKQFDYNTDESES